MRIFRVALWIVTCLLVGSATAHAEDEFLRIPLEAKDVPAPHSEWYGLYMKDTKMGWFHLAFGRKGEGADAVYFIGEAAKMRLVSQGQKIEMEFSEQMEFDGAAPFLFRGGRQSETEGKSVRVVEITRGEGGLSAKVSESGGTRDMAVPALDYNLADALTPERWFEQGRKEGDRARVRSFNMGKIRPNADQFTLLARKTTLVSGIATIWYEAKQVSELTGHEALGRTDAKGKILSLQFGGLFEGRLETEEEAKDISYGQDLFVFGMAKIDKPVGAAPSVGRLVLEVDGEAKNRLSSGPQQDVTTDAKTGTVTLSLGASVGGSVLATSEETQDALAESVEYPTKMPEVQALAAKGVGDARTPLEKVYRLVRFVSEFVEDADVPRHMSVQDIIKTRKGDCTEHAALFAALARAAGIPSRQVSGLMYMGDDALAFGGHEWDEVVLDGVWVPVDPTWTETVVDGAHIALEHGGKGMGSIATMGRLSFRLKEVVHRK